MNLRDRIGTALSVALVLAAGGCGSSGATKDDGGVSSCQPAGGGTRSVTNGVFDAPATIVGGS